MKRSKALSLLLMGSLGMGATGCGADRADEGMYTFTSIDECVTSALFSEAECVQFAKDAVAATPRFSSKEDCEASFGVGACDSPAPRAGGGTPGAGGDGTPGATGDGSTVAHGSGSFWMPMMMGYMAGRFLGGGGMMQGSQGLYRDPASKPGDRSSFRTATGDTVKTDPRGRVTNPSPRLTQSLGHNAKPAMSRSGSRTGGGFSGNKSFGGASS